MNDKQSTCSCGCGCGENIVLACSGASDLGQMSDVIARKLRDENVRSMNCLAKLGFQDAATIEQFKAANLLVIDGCGIDCGKKTLQAAGITDFEQLRITDMGFKKGGCAASDENVEKIYNQAKIIY